HGDYHIKNIMRQGNENLLIDMDTLSVGHPIYELSQMYLAYLGFSELKPEEIKHFLGIDHETAAAFWNSSLKFYFEGQPQAAIDDAVLKARIIGYARLLRRTLRREPGNAALIAHCKTQLCAHVPQVDTLYF
ncbi:MAG: phosphotransferase, partial [Clostridia bacterium]|nr:phosphotransferase [Clostridia bacterium]